MSSKIVLVCFASLFSMSSFAGEIVERNIKSFSCSVGQRVCSVDISGDAVGPRECPATTLYFKVNSDNNGDAVFSLLSSAFFANKKVKFTLSDSCADSGEPKATFDSVQVLN